VWLGVADGAALFEALASEVGARLAPLGHEPEARRFHAHLTLARLRAPADVRTELGNSDATAVGVPWTVREVVVYESRLRRTGAEYLPRTVLPLPDPST
jgi:2'-5' RNA ligase